MVLETKFEIIGIRELQQFFNVTAPNKIQKGVNDGLSEIGNAIHNTTTVLCPVDTGALQSSIEVTVAGDTITAHAGEDYASYVDEGTSRMDAEPFFTKPIEGIVSGLNRVIESNLSRTGIFSK